MPQTPEATTLSSIDDNERLLELEQERIAIREQIDSKISTPDLTGEQLDIVIRGAQTRMDEFASNPSDISNDGRRLKETWDWLAATVGKSEFEGIDYSDKTLQQARNSFLCAAFEAVNQSYANGNVGAADNMASGIIESYLDPSALGYSIIIADTEGIDGQAEVFSYVQQSPVTRHLAKEVAGEIVLNGAYADRESLFGEQILRKDPIAQIEMINTVANLAMQSMYWAESMPPQERHKLMPFAVHTLNGLDEVRSSEDIAPFVDLAIQARGDEIYQSLMLESGYADGLLNEPIHPQVDGEAFNKGLTQEQLHEQFPAASNGYLQIVSDSAVVQIERGILINELTTRDGKKVNLADTSQRNDLGITENESMLLRTLYHPHMRNLTENQLGIALNDLSLSTQRHLLAFMVEAEPQRYSRLVRTLDEAGEHRQQLAEAFLAAEFGDDFGDILLELAEHLPAGEMHPLLEKIQEIREYSSQFSQFFEKFDDDVAEEIRGSIAERVTEVLYVAKKLAVSEDNIATKRVLGRRLTVTDMSEVDAALSLVNTHLRQTVEALETGKVTGIYDENGRTGWGLGDNRQVLVQVKLEGDERGEHIVGVEYSEEAQINFSTDVSSEEGQEVPIYIADYLRRYALSLRIDLSGTLRDVNGGKVGFDATKEQLSAELDFGSLRASEDNPNYKVAKIISLGRKIRDAELGKGRSQGYHTSLSSKYGEKAVFRQLGEFVNAKFYPRLLGRVALVQLFGRRPVGSSPEQSEKAVA